MNSKQTKRLIVKYHEQEISFDIEYRNRRTMAIHIEPPDRVSVYAPMGIPEDIIKERVRLKGRWILNKLIQLKDMVPENPNIVFADGQSFLFLGKKYPLKILKNGRKRPKVFFSDDKFYLELDESDHIKMRKAMGKWYRNKADRIIDDRVGIYIDIIGRAPQDIKVKEQKKRWGSCTAKGKLYFNWRIIMAPPAIIDYVVVHEMCHLIHLNHSKYFWQEVGSVLPDYKKRRKWLRANSLKLDF